MTWSECVEVGCVQVFNSLKLTAYDLSVDMLDVHAVRIIHILSIL